MQPLNNRPQGALMTVNVETLPIIECECGGTNFIPSMNLRFANRITSPTGKPHIVQVPNGWTCISCGGLNSFKRTPETSDLFQDSPKESTL